MGVKKPVTLALSWAGEGRHGTVPLIWAAALVKLRFPGFSFPNCCTEATGGRCVLTVLYELPSDGPEGSLEVGENLGGLGLVLGGPLNTAGPTQVTWGR